MFLLSSFIIISFINCDVITKWTSLSYDVPYTTYFCGLVGYNNVDNKIYLFGGYTYEPERDYVKDVYTYDTNNDTFEHIGSIHETVAGVDACVKSYININNVIYFNNHQRIICKFDMIQHTIQVPIVNAPRLDIYYKCVTSPNDALIYFIGGGSWANRDVVSNVFSIYNINTNELYSGTDLPFGISWLGCEYINNKIVIFGGNIASNEAIDNVYKININDEYNVNDDWIQINSLTIPRRFHTTVAVYDYVYIISMYIHCGILIIFNIF